MELYISSMDVEDVVLRIFRELCIPAGGRLSYATLVKEWPKTRLRQDDLAAGVRRLEKLRDVQSMQTPDGIVLVLSATGHERASKLSRSLRHGWRQRVKLSLVQLLRAQPDAGAAPPPKQRRLSDRVIPQL